MTISKQDNGKYLVDIRPAGRTGKRVRRLFSTKGEAVAFERWTLANQNNKEWLDKPADRRQLSELIDLWWKNHGSTLKDSKNLRWKINATCERLGNPRADQLTHAFFAEYRARRIADGKAPKTVNLEHRYLKSMFYKLKALNLFWDHNPMTGLPEMKLAQTELGFLTDEQISAVLGRLAGDNLAIAKLCLATGARWNEAAKLTSDRLTADKVTYTKTKNGKTRSVPISPSLANDIRNGREGRHQLFPDADYTHMRETIKQVAPNLPSGQATHVFRHTFSSHFMANGGNILVLKDILGHWKIQQTMVYAHFAPNHLIDAVGLNPLAKLHF